MITLDGVAFGDGAWPRASASISAGAVLVGSGAGGRTIVTMDGTRYLALGADGGERPSLAPIPGAGPFPTLTEVEGRSWLFTGSTADSSWYGFEADTAVAAGAPWPTPRGNFARTASRLEPPAMAEVAPDPVTDLVASAATDSSVRLSWTASGDDGRLGRPDHYVFVAEVRSFPGDPLPPAREWIVPTDADGGAVASVTLAPLDPATRYLITAVAVDHAGQRAPRSNVVEVMTEVGGSLRSSDGPGLTTAGNPAGVPVRFSWWLGAGASLGQSGAIHVYDLGGRRVATIPFRLRPAGVSTWDGRDRDGQRLPAGLYFATLATNRVEARTRFALVPR